jgi:hypothetical protein
MPMTQLISFFLMDHPNNWWGVQIINFLVMYSSPPLSNLFWNTLNLHVLPSVWETKIHTHTKCSFVYFDLYIFRHQVEDKMLQRVIPRLPRFLSAINFFMDGIWSVLKYINCSTLSEDLLPIFMLWFCPACCFQDDHVLSFIDQLLTTSS